MSGYSSSVIKANKQANAKHIGVKLGKVCIKRDVPVMEVAEYCRVSRMTVYNWFRGVSDPTGVRHALVEKLLSKLAAHSA